MVGEPTPARALSRPKFALPPVLGRFPLGRPPPGLPPPWKLPLPLGRLLKLLLGRSPLGEIVRELLLLGRLKLRSMLGELVRGELELMLCELLRGALLRGDELMLGELLRGEELMLDELLRGELLCELLGRLPPGPPPPGRRPCALPGMARAKAAAVKAITAIECKFFFSIMCGILLFANVSMLYVREVFRTII